MTSVLSDIVNVDVGASVTVIVSLREAIIPLMLVHVIVYVVSTDGLNICDPDSSRDPKVAPGSSVPLGTLSDSGIVKLVATHEDVGPVEDQVKTLVPPSAIVVDAMFRVNCGPVTDTG